MYYKNNEENRINVFLVLHVGSYVGTVWVILNNDGKNHLSHACLSISNEDVYTEMITEILKNYSFDSLYSYTSKWNHETLKIIENTSFIHIHPLTQEFIDSRNDINVDVDNYHLILFFK